MNRRAFLGGVLSTGLASTLLPGGAARAQAGEIRIGMSAAFRGAAAGLGSELYRGAHAYYGEINARGGLFGRSLTVVALDDGYNPDPCIRNTIQLLERDKVFLLSNYVGTPTLTRALPVIKQYADQSVVLVGNFTGAQPQREAPYVDQVFNVRASYRQEMAALVERFWQARGAALRRLLPDRRLRPQRHRRGGAGPRRAQRQDRGGGHLRAQRQVRGGHGHRGQGPPRGRQRGRALHRGLPGLRGLRALRARRGLDRADLQRLVRGIRRHARIAGQARPREGPRLHARPDQFPGGAELRRHRPAGRGRVPGPHGQAQPAGARGAARRRLHAAEVQLHQPRGLRERAGDRGGAAPGGGHRGAAASARRWNRSAASISASARRSPSRPSGTRGWTASTSPGSTASAGCRSPTGPRRSRHEHGHGRSEAGLEKARDAEARGGSGIARRDAAVPAARARFGLLGKITIFLVLVLLPVAIVSWVIAYRSLQENLSRGVHRQGQRHRQQPGRAPRRTSWSTATRPPCRRRSTSSPRSPAWPTSWSTIPSATLIAHTFAPVVPKGIIEKNMVPGQATRPQVQELTYLDPRGGGDARDHRHRRAHAGRPARDRSGGHGQVDHRHRGGRGRQFPAPGAGRDRGGRGARGRGLRAADHAAGQRAR